MGKNKTNFGVEKYGWNTKDGGRVFENFNPASNLPYYEAPEIKSKSKGRRKK